MKDLRTRLIELLKSIVDKSNTKVSKQLLEHKIEYYEKAIEAEI